MGFEKFVNHDYIADTLKDKEVYFLWSGGEDSTFLLHYFLANRLFALCRFVVMTIITPSEIYDRDKILQCKDYFKSKGVDWVVLSTEESISRSIPDEKACLFCKSIRRKLIADYFSTNNRKNYIIVTGHTSLDLAAYYFEMLINQFSGVQLESTERYLEIANKFLQFYESYSGAGIFRPLSLIPYGKIDSKKIIKKEIPLIVNKECYWINQRKRLLQKYLIQGEFNISPELITRKFVEDFHIPALSRFEEIPFEVYLL